MAIRINEEAFSPDQPARPMEVQQHLTGISYPVGRQELLDQAFENGVPEGVLSALNLLPDREYQSMTDVISGLGEGGLE